MMFILTIGVCVLAWKLMQANRRRRIAYGHSVVPGQPRLMVGPDDQQHPTWCPNCGRDF